MSTTQSHLCCNPECPIRDSERKENCVKCSRCRKTIDCSILCQDCSSDMSLGSPSQSSTSTEETFVLLLSLSMQDMLADTGKRVISALRSKVRVIQASNVRKALRYLADTNLKGVFVADEGIVEKENAEVLYALIEWVNAGGIAVIGGLFASFISFTEFDGFFNKWGLPWTMGDYTRMSLVLNPSIHQLSSHSANLATSFSMKALHLRGVKAEDIIYVPEEDEDSDPDSDSDVQFRDFPPQNVSVAYTRVGDGFLGYVGDVNSAEGSTSAVLAMLKL